MNEKKPLIVIAGPTAVGKTALSISLAKKVNGEIISADSMQVYQYMDIGTAKITEAEMQGVKHYLIDEIDPKTDFNVVLFQSLAKQYMGEIYGKGKIPILVGGTGFYIQALLYDINFEENEQESEIRKELEQLLAQKGTDYLHGFLEEIDPESAQSIHKNNAKRVIRAIEYYRQTGEKISEHNKRESERESPYDFAYFVLTMDRTELYDRINLRVDQMMQKGLLEEVTWLRGQGYTKNLVSMQGLGYKEILDYLDGNTTLNDAVEILKRDTRHFAKRQLTWFKREEDVIWVEKQSDTKEEEILHQCMEVLKQKSIID